MTNGKPSRPRPSMQESRPPIRGVTFNFAISASTANAAAGQAVEYVDAGVSGAKASREQLDRMMLDARRGKVEVVICWRFDRFARSTKHLLEALEEFKSLGIGFISHQEAIDTTSPMGKLLFTIVAAMAEMERSILIERVKAGVATAKANGKSFGRPKKVFRRDTAIEMRRLGYSWRKISQMLNVPVSTLRDGCAESPSKSESERDAKQMKKARPPRRTKTISFPDTSLFDLPQKNHFLESATESICAASLKFLRIST